MVDESSRSGSSGVSAVIYSKDSVPDWPFRARGVRKIVLGEPPAGDEKKPLGVSALPNDFANRFPELTHLHLWQLEGLQRLPDLPPKLMCLDIRGCAQLTGLPALPATLDTLDLGGCTGLTSLPDSVFPALERFYFDGCSSLLDFSLYGFLHRLEKSHVYEIDGSECPAVTSLQQFPAEKLRKLVLAGCSRLTDIGRIGDFKALEHLNLGNCTGIRVFPALPPKLRFLVLDGAENLNLFMAQDIGPYDRGKNGQNVARAFVSRKKFGKDLGVMPHAKLLLMGSGRVGKTTLAKRLQWEEVKPLGNPSLEPSPKEPFNHKIHFWKWETGLILPEAEKAALEERAAAARIQLPRTPDGHLAGGIRIWDFGGQEVYHGTHRIFAGEGSIFLLVWTQQPSKLEEPPEGAKEIWDDLNRQRPLAYWLDYIYSMRPDAQVALVCTKCPNPDAMDPKPDWRTRAPKYAHKELPQFFVDSLDDLCGQHVEYQRLVRWIREACGKEALRIGILQPRFYSEVSDLVGRWQQENLAVREAGGLLEHDDHLLSQWGSWVKTVIAAHVPPKGGLPVEESDVAVITDYLHEAGHLFRIRQRSCNTVLIDQEWAADHIYQLIDCRGPLWRLVRAKGGWFTRADLEAGTFWKGVVNQGLGEQLLAYMQDCRIITRISVAERGGSRGHSGQDLFLASNKWLLPEYKDKLQTMAESQLQKARDQEDVIELDKFEFENVTLSEFDFRNLQAQMAGVFGTGGIYFRNGFQILDETAPPRWCFRLRWKPVAEDSFDGTIDAVLIAHRRIADRVAEELENMCYAGEGPLAGRPRTVLRKHGSEGDLRPEFFLPRQREDTPASRRDSSVPAATPQSSKVDPAGTDAGVLRILHLSDFHFSESKGWDQDPVVRALLDNIEGFVRSGLGPHLIAVTGDIAQAGKRKEYSRASEWFTELLTRTRLAPADLLLVTGNHDVDRSEVIGRVEVEALQSELLKASSQDKIASALGTKPSRSLLLKRHSEWLRFASKTTCRKLDVPWWTLSRTVNGISLHIVGFCSSLMSWRDGEQGNLLIGRWQVHQLLSKEDGALAIALMHHPFSYLADWDGQEVEEAIQHHFAVVLRGHLHRQKQEQRVSDPGRPDLLVLEPA